MVNTLRIVSVSCSVLLLALTGWAAVHYGPPLEFLPSAAIAVAILGLPHLLAHLKLWVRQGIRYVESRRAEGVEQGTTFVSADADPDPEGALSEIADTVEDVYSDVKNETFPEGEGLMVNHDGFHNSFVRLTRGGRLVVTGASKKTRSLARRVGDLRDVTMENRSNNPLLGPIPVRGAPRWFLGLFLVALLVVGVGGVANAAYPTDVYTSPEKTVFVSYDARGEFSPGTTATDTRLGKAAFTVDALSEEAVEMRWEKNESPYLVENGEQALAMSEDVREELRAAREGSLSPAERRRADRIESELHAAEREVANAIDERLADGTTGPYAAQLREIRDELRRAADRPVGGD